MEVVIKDLTDENIDDHVGLCYGKHTVAPTLREGGTKKKRWLRKALRAFGSCAKIAYVDDKPVGFVEFFPVSMVPAFPEKERKAILITCVYVIRGYQGKGVGSRLLQSMIEDLRHRKIACFGNARAEVVGIGSWGAHTGFPEARPRFRKFFFKNGFQEAPDWPDPTGIGGILEYKL